MSVEFLSMLAGGFLSLLFSYVPRLKPWFDALEADYKRLVMLGSLLLLSLAIFGAGCARLDVFGVVVTCDTAGALEVLKIFVYAAVANQGAYLLTPKPQ